jgi:protein-L-isoaspartate(D-aspartate) O-methyltransferase
MLRADVLHHDLIDQIIARGSLWSAALIEAFRATPRHLFLDRVWSQREGWRQINPATASEEDWRLLYTDRAITTRLGSAEGESAIAISSSSQPSLMAQMLEDLQLRPGLRVLEIGAGTGYNAALLAHVVGSVISIDVDREVLADARRHLEQLPDRDVQLVHADGRLGYPPAAPYDRIQVTAASEDLEPAWLAQLQPGGLVQVPIDFAPGLAWLMQGEVRQGVFVGNLTRPAYFMPLRDEGETGRDRSVARHPLPSPDRLTIRPSPEARWSDRRVHDSLREVLPSLALLALLQGLSIDYTVATDGRGAYGVADLERGEVCWLGPTQWYISGKGGEELGERLWRTWLDLGAPRASEWHIQAAPDSRLLRPNPAARAAHTRLGKRCAQLWELIEPRRRMWQE